MRSHTCLLDLRFRNMMYKILLVISLSFVLLISAVHADEYNMRAGLWEITTTSDLLLFVPHIPPAQMKNIKDLAKEYGFDMPQIENGAAISKTCVTPEMASKKILPNFYQDQSGCATENAIRDGNHYKIEFICNGAYLKGKGIAEAHLNSAESFIGQTKFTGTAQGNALDEKAEISGKWLDASCNEVKPM